MKCTTAMMMVVALSTTLLACDSSSEDEPEARVGPLVDATVDELDEQAEIFCDCWQAAGFDSRNQCTNEFLIFGPAQVRCMKDAFSQDADIAEDYLDCLLPLEREYTTCLDSRLECNDFGTAEVCGEDYSVGLDGCIGLPPTILRDLDACVG